MIVDWYKVVDMGLTKHFLIVAIPAQHFIMKEVPYLKVNTYLATLNVKNTK